MYILRSLLILSFAQDIVSLLNRGGSYRNVFRLEERASDPDLILKVAEIELDYDVRDYEFMRVEGAVFSALPKHPLLVETFGFCALSLFSEPMMSGDVEKRAVP